MPAILEEFMDLLRKAQDQQASDLHLAAGAPPMLRIHGSLQPARQASLTAEEAAGLVGALLTEGQAARLEAAGEVDFSYEVAGLSRYRMNAYRQRGRTGLAVRLIPAQIPTLEQLQLPPAVQGLAVRPHGLVLVTGPTGSGKSSTLAAMIHYINHSQKKHIVTLEDPIEFLHPHGQSVINQREVGSDTRSFADGLRAALRQDPDVILVGEMRDLETITAAVTAAETGHLVFATLHTTDAPQTIDRIIDAFPAHQQGQIRVQLAAVLAGVVSQRLLPRPRGAGRVCVTEIMMNTPAVANLIRSEKVHQIKSVMQTGRLQGMHTMEMAIKEQLQQGLVDPQAAKAYLQEGGL